MREIYKKTSIIVLAIVTLLMFSFCIGFMIVPAHAGDDENDNVYVEIYNNGLGEHGIVTYPYDDTKVANDYVDTEGYDGENTVLKFDGKSSTNPQMYIDIGNVVDLRTGDGRDNFYEQTSLEFYIKLNNELSKYANIFLLQDRGEEVRAQYPKYGRYWYVRSSLRLDNYVDADAIGVWQFIRIPIKHFPASGSYVNEQGSAVSGQSIQFSKIAGVAFSMAFGTGYNYNSPNEVTAEIGKIQFCVGNLPDPNLGVSLINQTEFYEKVATADFTTVDLSEVATAAFTGGASVAWSGQGTQNELSGFDLFDDQTFFGIPFYILNPSSHDKTVVGLRGKAYDVYDLACESFSIPVNKKVDGAYMIHNLVYTASEMALYTWVYEDGTEHTTKIQANEQVYGWWGLGESTVCPKIWTGENEEATSMSNSIGLNMFPFINPEPDKTVSEIRFEIADPESAAYIIITAITLVDWQDDDGLYMPDIENIFVVDTEDWYEYELADLESLQGTALDVSYLLDKDIDGNGHVVVKGDRFAYEDGRIVNFWGTGVNAIYEDREDVKTLIDTVAACGYNMIRLFYIDSGNGNTIYGDSKDYTKPDPECLDQFNFFWAYCKQKGIYIDLLLSGSYFPTELFNGDQIAEGEAKWGLFLDERLQNVYMDMWQKTLNIVNPYTGTKLIEDPVLAIVEIFNEMDLIGQWTSNVYTSDTYSKMFQEQFNNWLAEKYSDDEELFAAWAEEGKKGLATNESMLDNSVKISAAIIELDNNYSSVRMRDTFEFVCSLEQNLYDKFYQYIKTPIEDGGLGCKSIVAGGTQMGVRERADLFINTGYDFVARHKYESHPQGAHYLTGGVATPSSGAMAGNHEDSALAREGARRIAGLPFIVTETMECVNVHSAEFNLLTAAIYSYQGWSVESFQFFGSSLDTRSSIIYNPIQVMDRPSVFSTTFSSALLYMRNEITGASEGYYRAFTIDETYDAVDQTFGLPYGSYVVGKTGIYFVDEEGNVIFRNESIDIDEFESDESIIEKVKHSRLVSEGGEIIWTAAKTQVMINTLQTQAVVGYLSGSEFSLNDVDIVTSTDFANITVSALGLKKDNTVDITQTLSNAERILVTAIGQERNTGMTYNASGSIVTNGGEAPILLEQIIGQITFKTYDDFVIYILNTSGQRIGEAKYYKNDLGYTVLDMTLNDQTMFYEVVRVGTSSTKVEFSEFRDVATEQASMYETIAQYMPSGTDTLYLVNENMDRGDYVGGIVRALQLTSDSANAYSDADERHQAYEEFKIARGLDLVGGLRINAYEDLSKKDGYSIMYNALEAKGIKMNADTSLLLNNDKINLEGLSDEEIQKFAGLISVNVISVSDLENVDFNTAIMTRGESVQLIFNAMNAKDATSNNSPEFGLVIGLICAGGCVLVIGAGIAIALILKKRKIASKNN